MELKLSKVIFLINHKKYKVLFKLTRTRFQGFAQKNYLCKFITAIILHLYHE